MLFVQFVPLFIYEYRHLLAGQDTAQGGMLHFKRSRGELAHQRRAIRIFTSGENPAFCFLFLIVAGLRNFYNNIDRHGFVSVTVFSLFGGIIFNHLA